MYNTETQTTTKSKKMSKADPIKKPGLVLATSGKMFIIFIHKIQLFRLYSLENITAFC